jgi:CzcA family heavy metal efflux pump
MLRALVSFSLRFRGVVMALACVVIGYGIYTALHANLDVFPDFVPPQVTVQTEAPGLAPEQVESLVTQPIETAVSGLGNQESMRSSSIQGLSIITLVFKEGTDIFRARQLLAEKLNEVTGRLPIGVKSPKMSPLTSATMDLLKIGLTSTNLSPMALRTFADWTLKPRLLAVPGVAKCSAFGGGVRQLQVQVLPDRLRGYDLALADVLAAARLSTGVLGAGFVDTENQRILLQTEGQSLTPEALANVVVLGGTNGSVIRLKDIAHVVEGPEPQFGGCIVQGRPGVLMTMSGQFGANTLEVTHRLEAALAEMSPVFAKEGIQLWPGLHRPATFVESSLRNIQSSLLLGALLVSVVLFLFLGNKRTAFISLTAIPLSLLTAVIVLDRLGVSLNTITLGGLAIAIGEVVDDAIIDVENIFRRLRENQAASTPRPIFRVILEASIEVRTAVVYATFIVALVFLPVLTLTGLQGAFFAPLALSYIIAILASLAVALTLTPALAFLFFGRGVRTAAEPRLQRWLKAGYEAVLRRLAGHPGWVMALGLLICLAAVTRLPEFGHEFLPTFREHHFVLQASLAPGSSLEETLRVGRTISDALLADPRIATVEQQVGRAEQGEDPWGPHRSEFHVELKPIHGAEEAETEEAIRKLLEGIPGIQFEVMTFLADRIGESISGETQPVVINIFGNDLDVLDAKAREIRKVLEGVPGAKDVQVKSPPGAPRLTVKLRTERLTQLGFRPVEVLEAVQTAYQGTVVAQTFHGNRVEDVAVILEEKHRRDPEGIGSLPLRSAQGLRVLLRELADIYPASGRPEILHDGARRRQTITCDVSGVDVGTVVATAAKRIEARVQFPGGTYVEYEGAAAAEAKARQQILLHSSMAGVGILMLLTVVFRTWRNLLLVLANLPFALVGGVAALFVCGWISPELGSLNIGSLVGFVTLFGITMRNSIMMISHFEHLVREEGLTWGPEAALRGARERLIPILMTALVTALGLLPLALGSGEAGREIEGPMAIVILGGLITSTVLNLLMLPTLALRFGRFEGAGEPVS